MAPRPSWQGYLRLSLVTCPVAMLPATSEAEKVRFHTLNRATGNRVHARYVDAETGKPVDDEDQVKGYEREDGEYVMLEDEELRGRRAGKHPHDRHRLLRAGRFDRLDLVRHAALPDPGRQGGRGGLLGHPRSHGEIRTRARSRAWCSITASAPCCWSRATRAWSCGRCATATRCATKPSISKGIKGKPDPKEKKRLAQLIEEHTQGWSPSLAADPVQQALLSMIAAKQKRARRGTKKSAGGQGGNVIDLMAVLKKSLQGGLPQRR